MTTTRYKLVLSRDQMEKISTFHSGFLIDEHILMEQVTEWLYANFDDTWSYDFFNSRHISFKTENDALVFKLRWL
jgi:hypothetical protein